LGSGTSPFIPFGIQLYHAFLTTILLRHAELCTRKAHYAAEQLSRAAGTRLRFDRPFFKEFTLQVEDKGDETSHTVARKR